MRRTNTPDLRLVVVDSLEGQKNARDDGYNVPKVAGQCHVRLLEHVRPHIHLGLISMATTYGRAEQGIPVVFPLAQIARLRS